MVQNMNVGRISIQMVTSWLSVTLWHCHDSRRSLQSSTTIIFSWATINYFSSKHVEKILGEKSYFFLSRWAPYCGGPILNYLRPVCQDYAANLLWLGMDCCVAYRGNFLTVIIDAMFKQIATSRKGPSFLSTMDHHVFRFATRGQCIIGKS